MQIRKWSITPLQDDLPELEDVDVSEFTGESTSGHPSEDWKNEKDLCEEKDKKQVIETVFVGKSQHEERAGGSIFGSSRSNTRDKQQPLIAEVFSGKCTFSAS